MAAPTTGIGKIIVNLLNAARSLGRFDESDARVTRIAGAKVLVVLLHGYASRPHELRSLVPVIDEALKDKHDKNSLPDIFAPGLPLHFFSFADPLEICRELLEQIDALYEKYQYRSIIFVGHSCGSLIARKLIVCAFGSSPEAPIEARLRIDGPRPWAPAIDRAVLVAGMNRGWSISRHLSIPMIIFWQIGIIIGHVLATLRMAMARRHLPLIFAVRRGSNFITQLRLQWLSLRRRMEVAAQTAEKSGQAPHTIATIQLLGSVDDVVSPIDHVDPVAGSDFVYLDVPRSGHFDIVQMWRTERDQKTVNPRGAARADTFLAALKLDRSILQRMSLQPFDGSLDAPREDVGGVVFVIHGIRDPGYWTSKIARRVVSLGRSQQPAVQFATETSTYGYFAMLPFIIPSRRRAKVEWLMDRYAECRARYPCARFHFVGHSNGTYLLARALEDYPCAQFERVILAGSVIRTDYDWGRFLGNGQVGKIVNFVATADWVLALFPKAFQRLDVVSRLLTFGRGRLFDLGAAGQDGFCHGEKEPDLAFIRGGHGAALREDLWDGLATFVVRGTVPTLPPRIHREKPNGFWKLIGAAAPLPLATIVGAVAVLTYLLLTRDMLFGIDLSVQWWRAFLVGIWLWALYRVLTWL